MPESPEFFSISEENLDGNQERIIKNIKNIYDSTKGDFERLSKFSSLTNFEQNIEVALPNRYADKRCEQRYKEIVTDHEEYLRGRDEFPPKKSFSEISDAPTKRHIFQECVMPNLTK